MSLGNPQRFSLHGRESLRKTIATKSGSAAQTVFQCILGQVFAHQKFIYSFILMKDLIQQEADTTINIYAHNDRISMKQKLTELKKGINSSTIIVGNFIILQ